jgi:hypothetical protein
MRIVLFLMHLPCGVPSMASINKVETDRLNYNKKRFLGFVL